jgi:hypothetical protein
MDNTAEAAVGWGPLPSPEESLSSTMIQVGAAVLSDADALAILALAA